MYDKKKDYPKPLKSQKLSMMTTDGKTDKDTKARP